MRSRGKRVLSAIERDPGILERFWSHVDKDESEDGCWQWRGQCGQPGYASFRVGQCSIASSHIAWFSRTGELPSGGRIDRLCVNCLCVRPSHLAWIVGRATERRLLAEADGYLDLGGVPRFLDDPPPRAPHVVRTAV